MKLAYQRAGQGTPLVLVHGFLASSQIWHEQIKYFSESHDVIAVDLPGFGESNQITAPKTIAGFAQSVIDLLDDLKVEQFSLLGHSMGGMVVQEIAAMIPNRVSHLICYGTGPVGELPQRFETIEQSRARLKSEGLSKMAKGIAATWYMQGDAHPSYPLCLEMAANVSDITADACFTAWQTWDGRAQLKDIKATALIIWGEYDRSYGRPQVEALKTGIKTCALSVIPGCAHNVHLENPDLFNQVLADFLPKG